MHKKIFALILLDQITKLLLWPRDFFMGPLRVHQVKNFGLAFSLDFGLVNNLIIISLALIFFLYYFYTNDLKDSHKGKIIFALILAGAISNIVDRIYLGYVRDYLDFGLAFTFNLADAMIVVGLFLLLISENKSNQLS